MMLILRYDVRSTEWKRRALDLHLEGVGDVSISKRAEILLVHVYSTIYHWH